MQTKLNTAAKKLIPDTIIGCATTVEELRTILAELPGDKSLSCGDVDLGGYDIAYTNYIVVSTNGDSLHFGHLEKEAFENSKKLTEEEYQLLVE